MRMLHSAARLVAAFVLLGATAWANPIDTFPVDQIRPGMVGEGLTVFAGDKVEPFRAHIMGVLRDYGPKQNLILAKLEGGPLAATGVIAGMSGSPVYIDGKIAGAVAFSFPFSKEPIAGITPIGEMIEATAPGPRSPAARLSFPLTPESLESAFRSRLPNVPVQGTSLSGVDLLRPYLGRLLSPIATPASLHGFPPEVLDLVAPLLRKLGVEPLLGGGMMPASASSTGQASEGDGRPVQPGDSIGIGLVTGDLDVSAVGTVTHVDPLTRSVYAFGHPLFNLGPIEYPMRQTTVHLVLPSLYNSFKLSSSGPVVGTWVQDRLTAVKGILNTRPRMIPLAVEVTTSRGQQRSYQLQIVNDELFSPVLAYVSLISILQTTERDFGSQTVEVSARLRMEDDQLVIIEDMFADEQPGIAASAMVAAPLSFLMTNDFRKVQVQDIRVNIKASESPQTARLVRAWLDTDHVAPGGSVPLKLLLQTYRGKEELKTVNVDIPANVAEGKLQVLVADAKTMAAVERQLIRSNFEPRNFQQLIRVLNGLRRNSHLYVRVNRPDRGGAIVAGEYFSSLPPSVLKVMEADQSSASFIPVQTSTLWEYELATDYSITGSRVLELTVRNP